MTESKTQPYIEVNRVDTAELTTEKIVKQPSRIASLYKYIVQSLFTIFPTILQYIHNNKNGIFGFFCVGITITMVSIIINTNLLSLSQSYVYDYTFKSCTINGKDTMCPTNKLNHTMHFYMDGVYISPYVSNGIQQSSVYFEYKFCEEMAVPKYPSNYQRHCNLMSAGIGSKVSLISGYTLSWLTLLHNLILLMGYCPWNAFHKLSWIFALVSFFCYSITLIIWQFLGHSDIISNKQLYSEAHAGMKIKIKYGYAIWVLLACCLTSVSSAFGLRLYIWKMKIEDFKFKYEESQSSSTIMSSADLNFIYGTTEQSSESLH